MAKIGSLYIGGKEKDGDAYFRGYSGTPMILCVSHFIFGLLGWLQGHQFIS